MRPNYASLYLLNETMANPIFGRDNTLDSRVGTDGLHLLFVEFCSMVSRANPRRITPWCASLAGHIGCVLFSGSQKQMRRINARGIVATMAHIQTIWNSSMREHVGHAMRLRGFISLPKINLPVSVLFSRANPLPALIGSALVDFGPKTIRERYRHTNNFTLESE